MYNATSNELVRTKTLVKNAIVVIDATPFKTWYENHYGVIVGKEAVTDAKLDAPYVAPKKDAPAAPAPTSPELIHHSTKAIAELKARRKTRVLDPHLFEQFSSGRQYSYPRLCVIALQFFWFSVCILSVLCFLFDLLSLSFIFCCSLFRSILMFAILGRLYACISSRPGQSGRADGYILEGAELQFYVKRMQKKKTK